MKNAISRRTVITAAPAAALCGPVAASQDDPFMIHYHTWVQARLDWRAAIEKPENDNWDTPECVQLEKLEHEHFLAMTKLRPITPEGFAALAHVFWDWIGPKDAGECEDDCEKMLELAVYRALSGQETPPTI